MGRHCSELSFLTVGMSLQVLHREQLQQLFVFAGFGGTFSFLQAPTDFCWGEGYPGYPGVCDL